MWRMWPRIQGEVIRGTLAAAAKEEGCGQACEFVRDGGGGVDSEMDLAGWRESDARTLHSMRRHLEQRVTYKTTLEGSLNNSFCVVDVLSNQSNWVESVYSAAEPREGNVSTMCLCLTHHTCQSL